MRFQNKRSRMLPLSSNRSEDGIAEEDQLANNAFAVTAG
jgi:hypothetical protein